MDGVDGSSFEHLNSAFLDPVANFGADECRKLLKALAERCPGVAMPPAVSAGELGGEIKLDRRAVDEVVRAIADEHNHGSVVWVAGDSELLVHVGKIRTTVSEGGVLVGIPVSCDQLRRATVKVYFAVGSPDEPAGLLASTPAKPDGPAVVVDRWGNEAIAFAWSSLMRALRHVAGEEGRDEEGDVLIPVALSASPDGLRLVTMARFPFARGR